MHLLRQMQINYIAGGRGYPLVKLKYDVSMKYSCALHRAYWPGSAIRG